MPEKSWFYEGEEGFSKKAQIDAYAKSRKERSAPVFWLRPQEGSEKDESANIVFVDDIGFWVWVHNLEVNGRYGNFYTCTKDLNKDIGGCPICKQMPKHYSQFNMFLTVIDTRVITLDDGKVLSNRKCLFPVKKDITPIIKELKKKYGTLVGQMFNVKRYTKSTASCGSHFDFVKKVNLKALGEGMDKKFDYFKLLAPPTPEEYASVGIVLETEEGTEAQELTEKELEKLDKELL